RDPDGNWRGVRTFSTGMQGLTVLGGRVAWSGDGKLLAMAQSGHEVCLRDAGTGQVVRTLTGMAGCYALAFSRDSKLLAVGDDFYGKSNEARGRVLVWETATGRLVRTLQ